MSSLYLARSDTPANLGNRCPACADFFGDGALRQSQARQRADLPDLLFGEPPVAITAGVELIAPFAQALMVQATKPIRFHPALTGFAGHYRFEPRPVAVARGNEKGRVERAIRYVRDSFFAGRNVSDVDALNVQAQDWCRGIAADRRCPGQEAVSVREAFAGEAPRLLPLPDNAYPLIEQVAVKAGKTPYIRFDLNDYSIPHTQVRRWLTVLADPAEVRIADGQHILARHGKGEQIEDEAHIQALVAQKRAARRHRATDQLFQAAPASETLLMQAAGRGGNIASIATALAGLLQRYGADRLLPVLLVIWIMVVGTVVWAIDREGFEFWFPAVVFVSGLLIAVGEFVINWLRRR